MILGELQHLPKAATGIEELLHSLPPLSHWPMPVWQQKPADAFLRLTGLGSPDAHPVLHGASALWNRWLHWVGMHMSWPSDSARNRSCLERGGEQGGGHVQTHIKTGEQGRAQCPRPVTRHERERARTRALTCRRNQRTRAQHGRSPGHGRGTLFDRPR
jgi:hypothetical protein